MLKKLLILFSLAFLFVACNQKTSEPEIELYVEHGEFTDSRDGQTYKTVTIESQTWMAENLNYKTIDSYCYNDVLDSCAIYGRLYSKYISMEVCPEGWHTPYQQDWIILLETIGGMETAGTKLHAQERWVDEWVKRDDEFGFSLLAPGMKRSGYQPLSSGYLDINHSARYWVYSDSSDVTRISLSGERVYFITYYEECALPIRCIKN